MIKVDIQDGYVLIGNVKHTLIEAAKVLQDIGAALELAADSPVESTNGKRETEWRIHAPGTGYAVLSDGTTLRVEKTPKGWVGSIDGKPINADAPAERKRDAQAMLLKSLA